MERDSYAIYLVEAEKDVQRFLPKLKQRQIVDKEGMQDG